MRVMFFLLCCFIPVLNGIAATNSWTGAGGDSFWNNSANWSRGEVPTYGDNVLITQPGDYTVTTDTSVQVATLEMGGTSGHQTLISAGVSAEWVLVSSNAAMELTSNSQVSATLTNYGIVRLNGDVMVADSGSVWNEGIIEAAPDLGRMLFYMGESSLMSHGSLSIGTNTTVTLAGTLSLLGSPISSGSGLLELDGSIQFGSEATFGSDVIFVNGGISGDSVWSGPGTFHWIDGIFLDGSTTLTSNFTFKVNTGGSSVRELENHHLINHGLFIFEDGTGLRASTSGFLENHGTILLDGEYFEASGIINNGLIVATNGWSQLNGAGVGITNSGGTFYVGLGSELQLLGSFSFNDQTFISGQGELVLQCDLRGSGDVFIENAARSDEGNFRGNHVWKGPGKLRLTAGSSFGDSFFQFGSTTLAADFTIEVEHSEFNHDITNFGRIVTLSNGAAYSQAGIVNHGTIDIQSNGILTATSLLNEGVITQTNGILEIFGSMTNNGTLILQSGILKVQPGFCQEVGCVPPGGDYVAGPNAQHLVTISGYTPGIEYPRLICNQLTAGGAMDVQFANGFMPTNRSSFKLWDFQAVSNNFTSESLPPLQSPMYWETILHHQQYTIRTREPGHPTATLQLNYDNSLDGITVILNASPEIIYQLEASTNLLDWITVQTNFTSSYQPSIIPLPPEFESRPPTLFFRTFEP